MVMSEPLLALRAEHKLLILLIGAVNGRIPSKLHVHKELFVLTRIFPKLNSLLEFEAYRKGPFSRTVQDALEDLVERGYVVNVKGGYMLSQLGKEAYSRIVEELGQKRLLDVIRRIRKMYDKLDVDELLLIIYATYPEYTIESEELRRISSRAYEIIEKLFRKGYITERRKRELYGKIRQLRQS